MSTTKTYIGTKVVHALPMTRQAYHDYREWQLPDDEDGADEGYLVEYVDGGQANHPDFAGDISWSPKDVFEASYRAIERDGQVLTFGDALHMLKLGKKVARQGWNGKSMWLSLSGPGVRDVPASAFWSVNNAAYAEAQGGSAKVLPSITMKTATGEILMGWLASQSDMLAEDWMVVE